MNSCGLLDHIGYTKSLTFEDLKQDLDAVRANIHLIQSLDVSEEAKQLIVQELEEKVNEIKEQMHNYIDSL